MLQVCAMFFRREMNIHLRKGRAYSQYFNNEINRKHILCESVKIFAKATGVYQHASRKKSYSYTI